MAKKKKITSMKKSVKKVPNKLVENDRKPIIFKGNDFRDFKRSALFSSINYVVVVLYLIYVIFMNRSEFGAFTSVILYVLSIVFFAGMIIINYFLYKGWYCSWKLSTLFDVFIIIILIKNIVELYTNGYLDNLTLIILLFMIGLFFLSFKNRFSAESWKRMKLERRPNSDLRIGSMIIVIYSLLELLNLFLTIYMNDMTSVTKIMGLQIIFYALLIISGLFAFFNNKKGYHVMAILFSVYVISLLANYFVYTILYSQFDMLYEIVLFIWLYVFILELIFSPKTRDFIRTI